MAIISNIGTRVELVPMDGHFHNISVALYRQADTDGAALLVHTYSARDGAGERIDSIAETMVTLGGLERRPGNRLRFPCGSEHALAVRRTFLEAVKLDLSAPRSAHPLTTVDRKSGLTIEVDPLGDGQYRVRSAGDDPDSQGPRRVGVIVNGLLKLGDMRRVVSDEDTEDCVAFECGCSHDALVGLLLVRAPSVRAIVREQEAMSARGTLSAPSAQAD